MPEETKPFIKGAFILAAAALFIKILSAVYRVPFQNIVGDTGFYIYQQVYPFYGIAYVLASTGFPVIISRVAAEKDHQNEQNVKSKLQAAFIVLLFVGFGLFSFFFFGGDLIARWMGDPMLGPVIRVIAFPFLLLPFLSLWRGAFQGSGNMIPTALSQVTEQVIRVGAILLISFLLVGKGYTLYEVGRSTWAGAVVGSAAGAVLLAVFAGRNKKFYISPTLLPFREFVSAGKLVLVHGAAICFSGLLLILFQLVDSLNVYALLVHSGVESENAKALKGIFDRGQPLIQLGTTVAVSISLALVPAMTAAWSQGNKELLQKKTDSAVKLSAVAGAGAAIGLMNIIGPTNTMLFKNQDGSFELAVLAASIFLASMVMTFSGIFQGMGAALVPAKYLLVGIACKYALNIWLVPRYGTLGAALATNMGIGVIFILLFNELKKRIAVHAVLLRALPRLLIACTAMTAALQAWLLLFDLLGLEGRLWSAVSALSGVAVGGLLYITVLVCSRLFDQEELKHIPLYAKITALRWRTTAGRRTK